MNYDPHTVTLTGGTDVFGSDGEKVGSVSAVEGDYVVVSKGFFFPTDYYIPTSAINTANDDGVYLNVTKDEALTQGWDVVPETTTTTTYGTDQTTAAQGKWEANTELDRTTGNNATIADDESLRVELAEEELTAQTRPVERGAVQVDKVVTEEQQTLDVPVTEEQVTVNRRIVDRDVAPGETTFEEGTIEVPVHGEEVEVEKRARVREEIEIGKEQVTGTERVTDTVRREDARISDDTDSVVDDEDRPLR
jgi:uncharacterized protein (TIGR02271 family)